MSDDFQTAYAQASARLGDRVWLEYTTHEQTMAIYEELRALDAARELSGDRPGRGNGQLAVGSLAGRLRLIGQMEAWSVTGESILPTGRKTRALLAAVALSAPRPALRTRLAELLWSRRPEEQARASLRQEVQLLLRALAPANTEILQVTRDHLALQPGLIWIDVAEVMRATLEYPATLSLLDGDLLEDLDGTDPSFDMWLTAERERLRDSAKGVAETLLREQSEPGTAILAARRLLQIDRAHEEAWRTLMRAYFDLGERGMAIEAYERCRSVLADLLDAEPSDETRKLLTEIRGPSSKRLPPRPPSTPAPSLGPGGGGVAGGAGLAKGAIARPGPRAPNGARVGILPMRSAGLPNEISYLGPGLADEIATALSRFRWLSVVASGSVARLAKGNREEPANPAAPGIDFLLDGTIQNSRNRLRFSLRLLDLRANGQVVWARRFDRQADDPLAVQDEIASAVVAQIDPAMLLIEAKRSASRAVADPSPYQLVLRSVPLITRLERDSFMRAGEFLAQAIAMEPDHAGAHLYYGYWHCLLLSQGWASDPVETRARGAELAERAVVLDPASAGAFSMAGHLRAVLLQRLDEAAVLHERALELNPNLATAWALSAVTGAFQGDTRRAEGHLARYKALAPLDPYSALFEGLSGIVHLLKRDYQAAVAAGRAVTQLNPNFATGFKPYLAALGHLAQRREAEAVLRRLLAIEPGFSVERVLDATPLERQIDRDHYAEGLRLAGAP